MHSEREEITRRRINCIPQAGTVYDGTLTQRRHARLDHQLTLLEQALIRADGMDERIEFVTTKTIAIVIRRISGTRKRHEEKRRIKVASSTPYLGNGGPGLHDWAHSSTSAGEF